ncbi:MAG: hypothetical protein LLG00_05030 [Planctomycetaceae bacterium]|nr:hypothetical protein [Planctomycetaceae bacterium]
MKSVTKRASKIGTQKAKWIAEHKRLLATMKKTPPDTQLFWYCYGDLALLAGKIGRNCWKETEEIVARLAAPAMAAEVERIKQAMPNDERHRVRFGTLGSALMGEKKHYFLDGWYHVMVDAAPGILTTNVAKALTAEANRMLAVGRALKAANPAKGNRGKKAAAA